MYHGELFPEQLIRRKLPVILARKQAERYNDPERPGEKERIMANDQKTIRQLLFEKQDIKYRDFQAKLIPGMDPERMIGVRTPELRSLAKSLKNREDTEEFLADLPHRYFDENQLHAFCLCEEKSFEICIKRVDAFLPYVDNWATCDQLSPKVFKKHTDELLPYIRKWIGSGDTYRIRFGIGMLMQHFLDEAFDPAYPETVSQIRSSEYYVNMMIAWYFATAMAKQYDSVIPYIEEQRLDPRTHNKTIQKCVESFRITPEQKEYLKSLRIPAGNRQKARLDRIRCFEEILRYTEAELKKEPFEDSAELAEKIRKLADYYGSKEWKNDLAADEAGKLPVDLKRGVLSEDGIYNVLQQYEEQKK